MPKRSFEEYDEPYLSLENEEEAEMSSRISLDREVKSQIIRMIITRETRNLKVRKEHLNAIVKENRLKITKSPNLSDIGVEMSDIFAIEARLVGSHVEVKSCLESSSKTLLKDLIISSDHSTTVKDRTSGLFLLPANSKLDGSIDDYLLVWGGVTLLILALIAVNEGHIEETFLLEQLASFGISSNKSMTVANTGLNIYEVLLELLRRDYLIKNIADSQEGSLKNTYYGLGVRAIKDFPPVIFRHYLVNIFPKEDDIHQKVDVCLSRCFRDLTNSDADMRSSQRNFT
uniref:MAGE domain-containing protein n=1 Tax=Candidozyma auris TaxID=498019 RepID=A0A0L0P032_CANAR